MINIGAKLKTLIDQKGLNKTALASKLGMTESNFYTILKKSHIRTDLLIEFCKHLEVHPKIFFDDYELDVPGNDYPEESVSNTSSLEGPLRYDSMATRQLLNKLLNEKDHRLKDQEVRIVELKDYIDHLKKKEN